MYDDGDHHPNHLVYSVGLDRVHEPVISSHFMHQLCKDAGLQLYDNQQFAARARAVDVATMEQVLLPALLSVCEDFARERAAAASQRARENYRKYGLTSPRAVGLAETLTEVMFDPHYRRGPRETCSRELIRSKVLERLRDDAPIEMVIPALPFKFSSPLKTRGRLPDLAEVNFILGLYEIVLSLELIYRAARPHLPTPLARFTVISDGGRFNRLVGESDSVVSGYQRHVRHWIERLGLKTHIEVLDYRELLRDKLPAAARAAKDAIRERARLEYMRALMPIFNPCDMAATLAATAELDPDPESSNPEGRFSSLLKSLIYTLNYKTLEGFTPERAVALYRELTTHIFEPQGEPTQEQLRRAMLTEAWHAAIAYMAEIKSDRELPNDPILSCLPAHFRWTIHSKPGQLAISTSTALGTPVQAWAGAAVFKRTRGDRIRLATLPVLALEGAGAIPVCVHGREGEPALHEQPLFYIYPDIELVSIDDLLARIRRQLVRKRVS